MSSTTAADWMLIPNAADRLKWYQNKGNLQLNFFLSIIFVGMILNGYDGSIISGLQAIDAWHEDLGNPSATRIGLLNACGSFAGIVVGPIISYIDEHFGRRWGIRFYGWTVLIGSVIGCVAGVANVDGYAIFVTGRVFIGFGLTAFLMTSLIVVQEITHPRNRGTIAQSWNSYYILGLVIAAWVVFGTSRLTSSWSWRIPYILQLPLAVYILIGVQFVPETPRWLLGQGREEEALAFLVKYHGNGDPTDELVQFEFLEMKTAIKLEREAQAGKWSVIVRNPGSRYRLGLAALMTFLTNLSGSSIIYYYYTTVFDLVGITGATTQTGINAGLSMFTYFCQIGGVLAGKRVGRRTIILWVWPSLLLCLIGLCTCSGVFANTPGGSQAAGIVTVVFVWLYLGSFNFANPILWSYPAEVQTYSLRSKGLLVWNTVYQLQNAYVVWVDAIALEKIGFKYYAVYMPLVVIQWVLAYKYMVETRGYTLEEIAIAFDGPNAIVPELDRFQAQGMQMQRERDVESSDKESK